MHPSFEDQVLHTCVHGAPWNGVTTFRWAADATIILRARQAAFEWDYLLHQCRQRRVVVPVRNCLDYLRRHLDVAVPDTVLGQLRQERVSMIEVLDYRLRAQDPAKLTALSKSLLTLQNYRGSSKTLTEGSAVSAFSALMKERWAVDSVFVALVLTVFATLGRPSWLRSIARSIWRHDVRSAMLERRKPAKISEGPLDLSLSGDPRNALLYGWSRPETHGRWTDGPEAAMAFDVGVRSQGHLRVTMLLFGMVAAATRKLRVEIWANQQRLCNWRLGEADTRMHQRNLTFQHRCYGGASWSSISSSASRCHPTLSASLLMSAAWGFSCNAWHSSRSRKLPASPYRARLRPRIRNAFAAASKKWNRYASWPPWPPEMDHSA